MKDQARYRWIADHVLPYEREVRRWLSRKVRTADLDDLVQEGYARLLQADLSAVKDACSFFCRTVFNLWADQRRRSRVVQIDLLDGAEPLHIDEAPGPEQRASALQQWERLLQTVEQLPPRQRAAFELKQFVGLSTREIAERMNIAEKTARMHLRLAVVQVTESILDEEGMAPRASEVDDHESAKKRDQS
jgi:RNA polymerase sigma-70 factor (ECF subfamily)